MPIVSLILMAAASGATSGSHAQLLQLVEQHSASYVATSRQIWEHAELGYLEVQSSAALQAALRKDGFTVTSPRGGRTHWIHRQLRRRQAGDRYPR